MLGFRLEFNEGSSGQFFPGSKKLRPACGEHKSLSASMLGLADDLHRYNRQVLIGEQGHRES